MSDKEQIINHIKNVYSWKGLHYPCDMSKKQYQKVNHYMHFVFHFCLNPFRDTFNNDHIPNLKIAKHLMIRAVNDCL